MPTKEIRLSPSGIFFNALISPSFANSIAHWGTLSINNGAQPNFIYPGYANFASISQRLEITWPISCTFSQMRVRARVAGTGGNQLRYRLDINGADSGLEVLMLNTALTGNNLITVVNVNAGDALSLRVAKQGGPITTSPQNITVSFQISTEVL